jgi:hypothetical protein
MFRMGSLIGAAFILVCAATSLAVAQAVKREPPMGTLRPGQRLLVDDGTCGPGQIKEVIGGNHVKVGGRDHIVRERRCIPR